MTKYNEVVQDYYQQTELIVRKRARGEFRCNVPDTYIRRGEKPQPPEWKSKTHIPSLHTTTPFKAFPDDWVVIAGPKKPA